MKSLMPGIGLSENSLFLMNFCLSAPLRSFGIGNFCLSKSFLRSMSYDLMVLFLLFKSDILVSSLVFSLVFRS